MKYQRFVSLTAMLSFIVLAVSSAVLYLIPDRKVTSWTGWAFLGLDKQQWDNLHINLGILFLVMIFWHIYYNWKPIKNYLKKKKEWKVFTKEFNAALALTGLFAAGTITMTLPFSALINLGNGVKAINSLEIGNPPFGYAEYATLEDFCTITSIDPDEAMKRLKERGLSVRSPQETLKRIAADNHTSPKEIFEVIRGDHFRMELPGEIPVGIAHKSLHQLSREYRMDLDAFLQHLTHYGIKATPEMNFKRIAKENNLHPARLYSMLLASQRKAPR